MAHGYGRFYTFLTWFMYLWVAFVFALNMVTVVIIFDRTDTLEDALDGLAYSFNPLTTGIVILELMYLIPAIIAFFWRKRIRRKAAPTA